MRLGAVLLLRSAWRQVLDPVRASRIRWLAFAWVFTVGQLIFGAALLVGGTHVIAATGVFVVFAHAYVVSWGVHIHGAIYFTLSLISVIGLSGPVLGQPEPQRILKFAMLGSGVYWAWSAVMVCFSPALPGGTFSILAVVLYLMTASWPTMLGIAPPPLAEYRDIDTLIRIALKKGISTQVAADVAREFFFKAPDVDGS